MDKKAQNLSIKKPSATNHRAKVPYARTDLPNRKEPFPRTSLIGIVKAGNQNLRPETK